MGVHGLSTPLWSAVSVHQPNPPASGSAGVRPPAGPLDHGRPHRPSAKGRPWRRALTGWPAQSVVPPTMRWGVASRY